MTDLSETSRTGPRAWLILAVFLVVVMGVGAFIGASTAPGAWYAALNKPPFNPPNWIFGPVWSALYVLIAIAGWRTFLRNPTGTAMILWVTQMLLNWAWSPLWFSLHLIWPAFVCIMLMWLSIIGFIATTRRSDPVSAWLFAPYLLWVSFAALLNLSIALLN